MWCTKEIDTIYSELGTNLKGLTSGEVFRNKEQYGANILEKTKRVTLFDIFLSQFKSAFIYILLFATLIVFLLGEYVDGGIILFIIILNSVIGTFQEGKARNTLEALNKVIKSEATVIRDGKTVVILDEEVVPGDILILKSGDLVTADARLVESTDLKVNESSLTGESESVVKKVTTLADPKTPVADQLNMVFKGTYVVSGMARVLVVATGKETEIGKVAKQLDELHAEIPLKQNIKNLSVIVIWSVVAVSLIVFIFGLINGNDVSVMFKTVVAIAVSAIPESLPVVVTLVLATGVWRMTKKNALVKRLQAVEALGQAKVIALDKTGTITKNQMMVNKLYINGSVYEVSGDGYSPKGEITLGDERVNITTNEALELAGRVSAFTSAAEIAYSEESVEWKRLLGDPTEAALYVFAQKLGLPKEELESKYKKVLEIPFDFRTKHHSAINEIDGKLVLSVAGSPEMVLKNSAKIWKDGKEVKITQEDKEKIKEMISQFSKEGSRMIALAINTNPTKNITANSLPDLTFVGICSITDVIRPDVDEAIEAARNAGMKVVMITGDHLETAQAIALKVGICADCNGTLTGTQIDELTDEELDIEIEKTAVFARVTPQHKLRIIESYKRRGEIVAMTGDGINDALSLVAADLGVAMGKIGTEVAKEASDIILIDDNFDNIRVAVEEGRNIYNTIRKSVLYLLSTNVGELAVIAVAVVAGLPLPLLATQIIWLNMVTDTFLVAALAMEPKEKDLIRTKFRKTSKWFVDGLMALRISLIGLVMTVGTLALFIIFLPQGLPKAWTISLTVLTVFQWYNIFNVRSERKSVFTQNPFSNKFLIYGLIAAVGLHLLAVYNSFMQGVLHTTALSLNEWGLIFVVAFSIVVVEEVRKYFYRQSL